MDALQREEIRFGEDLLRSELLTEAQLGTVREYQDSLGGLIRDIVIKLGFVSDADLNTFLAQRERVKEVGTDSLVVDVALIARFPRSFIESRCVLPMRSEEGKILLAMADPHDLPTIDEAQFVLDSAVEVHAAPRSLLLEKITRHYALLDEQDPQPKLHLADELVADVADPTVAALAKLLLEKGMITAEEWGAMREQQNLH